MWTTTDTAWDTATAISAISAAMLETLRRGSSAEAQCLREELRAAGIFQRLKHELRLLCCDLLNPTARARMRSHEAISRALIELVVRFESILHDKYVKEVSTPELAVGSNSDVPNVQRLGSILCGGTSASFALELAIKPNRVTSLASLLPVLTRFNSVVDDDDSDDIHQHPEDTEKLKQKLRQDCSSIKGIMNTLHGALHGQWPCPQHIREHLNDEPDNSLALGQCLEAYMELDSRWILPGQPLNDAFVILKGDQIEQLCELNYVPSQRIVQSRDHCVCEIPNTYSQEVCLYLLFNADCRLWDDPNKALALSQRLWAIKENSPNFGLASLRSLLSERKLDFELAKRVEIIVARAALVLIDGPWMCDEHHLSLDTVFLSCIQDETDSYRLDPELTQVFIQTRFGSESRVKSNPYGQFQHAFPVIKALGILIADLESEFLHITAANPPANGLRRAQSILALVRKRYGLGSAIYRAIEFCLDRDPAGRYPGGRNAVSMGHHSFLEFLYGQVVLPLELELNISGQLPWHQIYQTGRPENSNISSAKKESGAAAPGPGNETLKYLPVLSTIDEANSETYTKVHPNSACSSDSWKKGKHHALREDTAKAAATQERNPSSKHWFDRLEDVHKITNNGRMLHYDGSADLSEEDIDNLIKVAILDTGVDLRHPAFQDYRQTGRLENGVDLVDPSNKDGDVDLDGHGTHMCHTLLKTAPYARVYPIRVFTKHEMLDESSTDKDSQENDQKNISASRVAKAIHLAVEDLDVDIISMSFAFRHEHSDIDRAIWAAHKREKGVLMFAAASNNTALEVEPVGYPATLKNRVICINSSTADGEKSKFSPHGVQGHHNFSTIGEDIHAAWPTPKQSTSGCPEGLYQLLSGTSSSTAIAAGIAALILDFSRKDIQGFDEREQEYWEQQKHKLWDTHEMRAVIRYCMTHRYEGQEYNFIKPWMLFHRDETAIAKDIMTASKNNFRSL